jgi:hypothetical protein
MAAPTNVLQREESSCQPGAVHTWHKADMLIAAWNVRYWGKRTTQGQAARGAVDPGVTAGARSALMLINRAAIITSSSAGPGGPGEAAGALR